ncbi:MAG: hypothetical protein Q8S00_18475 [Deltaproteobacteria bacterium]|nr:hypothetical protein [Deltaproteobacteria bacterium]MDZ4344871.1 hypothetical protein [Candidatus Binatia bacterium]
MKTMRTLFAALPLIGILGLNGGPVMAYEVHYIRLTGTLVSTEDGQRGNALNVAINGRQWIFRIAKIKNLLPSGVTESAILRYIFAPRVTVTGSQELLQNLQKAAIVSKPLTITGFLYSGSGVFFVTSFG